MDLRAHVIASGTRGLPLTRLGGSTVLFNRVRISTSSTFDWLATDCTRTRGMLSVSKSASKMGHGPLS